VTSRTDAKRSCVLAGGLKRAGPRESSQENSATRERLIEVLLIITGAWRLKRASCFEAPRCQSERPPPRPRIQRNGPLASIRDAYLDQPIGLCGHLVDMDIRASAVDTGAGAT